MKSVLQRKAVDIFSVQHCPTFPALHFTSAKAQRKALAPRPAFTAQASVTAAELPLSFTGSVTEDSRPAVGNHGELITQQAIKSLEAELDQGPSVAALRRFNDNLSKLKPAEWVEKLEPVMNELAYNLESFNPAFTAVLLKVQCCIGQSDYVRRDMALKNLIQPLAGEYGMHNGQEQAKTHRELFSEFYEDLMKSRLEDALAENPQPPHSVKLFNQMMNDLQSGGGHANALEQASYAMGYNLAIEYLADYEKTWMLDSFRELNDTVLVPQSRPLSQWLFLEVHAEGEAEHAAIGHRAVAGFVPSANTAIVRKAMQDHDRDFATFYNALADMLQ